MKIFVFIISIFTGLSAFGQLNVGTPDQLKTFFKTKTCIVLEDNPLLEFNIQVKDAVQKNWKLTEYEFITINQYLEKWKDPKCSFLTLDEMLFDGNNASAKYLFLGLTLGGSAKDESELPILCSVPLCYVGAGEETYAYKMATLLNFIQNHVLLTSKNPQLNSSNIIDYYNNSLSDVKTKTLYLIEDEMAPEIDTDSEVKKVYPYKFAFKTRDEIEEAIDASEDVVFVHKVGPVGSRDGARCWKILIGAADAKFYYFDFHKVSDRNPDALLESDLKKMSSN